MCIALTFENDDTEIHFSDSAKLAFSLENYCLQSFRLCISRKHKYLLLSNRISFIGKG